MSKPIIICDIDGCLNFYPDTFLRWVDSRFDIYKKDINSLKSFLGNEEYEKLKYEYRTCGIKRNLTVREGVIDALREIKRSGKKIWVLTTRPTFEPVKRDTIYWLKKNKIKYNKLIFTSEENKTKFIEKFKAKVSFIIDDDLKVGLHCAQKFKIPVFVFENGRKIQNKNPLLFLVNSWPEIANSLKRLNDKD